MGSSRQARWVVGVASSLVAFGLLLWLGQAAPFGWLPDGEPERWAVVVAFATLGATAVLAAMGWWAAQAPAASPASGREVRLSAKASGSGRVTQTAGSHYRTPSTGQPATGGAAPPLPEHVRMKATATEDGRIDQAGGDRT
ncbi:hypothetical protein [Streptomyces sp. NPDC001820]|uniref:hypothetical protein n=1 Tax=Streptomyces sp. NPDC001820 TaxID=3364613 RepID=UPI0036C63F69